MTETLNRRSTEVLSEKQLAALELIAIGYTNKEAARELGVSPRTIEVRLETARRLLGEVSRSEAIRLFHADSACEKTTCGPFTIASADPPGPKSPPQDDDISLEFRRTTEFRQPAPWEDFGVALLPGAKPSELGTRQRLTGILLGAVAIAVMMLLVVSVAAGLENLFRP